MRPDPSLRFALGAVAFVLGQLVGGAALATITIGKGEYEVPAIVVPSPQGPVAVFNLRSRSETRILLLGRTARGLRIASLARALKLKFRITREIEGPSGSAELLTYRELAGRDRVPLQVGNDLKPIQPR